MALPKHPLCSPLWLLRSISGGRSLPHIAQQCENKGFLLWSYSCFTSTASIRILTAEVLQMDSMEVATFSSKPSSLLCMSDSIVILLDSVRVSILFSNHSSLSWMTDPIQKLSSTLLEVLASCGHLFELLFNMDVSCCQAKFMSTH